MALIRPRLNDYHGLAFTQESVDFAIPFLDEDIPLYLDPFLLWKSASQQDSALHTAIVASFNNIAHMSNKGRERDAIETLVKLSECAEVGLGSARDKQGKRIGEKTAVEIVELFRTIPDIKNGGLDHIEEIQLLVAQVSKDRVSDIACSLMKSFLIDFTLEQCQRHRIPLVNVDVEVFHYQTQTLVTERVALPVNPNDQRPIILVPKRWLRYMPWIKYDDYFKTSFTTDDHARERVRLLTLNRANYGSVREYVKQKERTQADCHTDPLFKPIPILSVKRKLEEVKALPTGKSEQADRRYENLMSQLLSSMLYPQLDFAETQSRTESGVLIRDLIFYNSRSMDFLEEIFAKYRSYQLVFELKNVRQLDRDHIHQLNRYLNDEFGQCGFLVTRRRVPSAMLKNMIDLWSGQRKAIVALTDEDIELMVEVFESKQRDPIEVVKRAYIDFVRALPS
jgi:hypothetical protein